MKRIFFLLTIGGLFYGVLMTGVITNSFAAEPIYQQVAKGEYYCPMHPQIRSDRKGSCPICGMDLVQDQSETESKLPTAAAIENKEAKLLYYRNPMDPKVTSPVPMKDPMGMDYVPVFDEGQSTAVGVSINDHKQQLIGVKRGVVSIRPLSVIMSTVGKVAYDPDLYVAQEEFIQALNTAAATRGSALVSIREQSQGLLASAEKKLLLMGMSRDEIAVLKRAGGAQENLYLPGKSGKAWIYLTVYEYELGLVKEGQEVEVDAIAYPGEIFKGTVVALTPIVNPESRSVRVRAEVEDKDGKLKPDMFVNAKIAIDLGEQLAIPVEAVMDSGVRKIVYVVKDNRFAAREVTVGPKAGELYGVVSGLREGEEVVTSGNFLIDSESKLKGAL